MLDSAFCVCLSFGIISCAADTVDGLWQKTGHADVCTKPQANADEQMIWSRGVTAQVAPRGARLSRIRKRDPLPEARCCMTSLVRGTEYSDEQHGWSGWSLSSQRALQEQTTSGGPCAGRFPQVSR